MMQRRVVRALLGIWLGLVLTWVIGCAAHEHRKVRVTEEQREGEVVEQPQGEMIVE